MRSSESCFRRKATEVLQYELKGDKGGENREEPLAQRSSDFSVVELAYRPLNHRESTNFSITHCPSSCRCTTGSGGDTWVGMVS